MTDEVEKELKKLEAQEKRILGLGKEMLSSSHYPLDFLASAVLDRSLHLIFGFTSLIRDENYITACHLVRCHLDNVLRFSAAWLVEEPHEFAMKVMSGVQIDKMKDREGKFLKDWYLRDKLNEEYSWITDIYKETSGFIHLSKKHIFTSSRLKDLEERTIELRISKKDNYVLDNARIEATQVMNEITNVLCHYIEGWIWTKNNPGKKPEEER